MGAIPVVEYVCERCGSWMRSTIHDGGSSSGVTCCGVPMVRREPTASAGEARELPGKVA